MIDYSEFPNLRTDNHRLTSDPLPDENCIAHAAGARGEWWEPVLGQIWPADPPYYNDKVESLIHIYQKLGYVICDSPDYEPGYEKIAIYGDRGTYTHAARQLTKDGTWTSKLGPEDDINHTTLEAVADGTYGKVVRVMKRRLHDDEGVKCCEQDHDEPAH